MPRCSWCEKEASCNNLDGLCSTKCREEMNASLKTTKINFGNFSNEEKENLARQYERLSKSFIYAGSFDETLYRELLEVKEEIEHYIDMTRDKYFAYLEANGLKHFDPNEKSSAAEE